MQYLTFCWSANWTARGLWPGWPVPCLRKVQKSKAGCCCLCCCLQAKASCGIEVFGGGGGGGVSSLDDGLLASMDDLRFCIRWGCCTCMVRYSRGWGLFLWRRSEKSSLKTDWSEKCIVCIILLYSSHQLRLGVIKWKLYTLLEDTQCFIRFFAPLFRSRSNAGGASLATIFRRKPFRKRLPNWPK